MGPPNFKSQDTGFCRLPSATERLLSEVTLRGVCLELIEDWIQTFQAAPEMPANKQPHLIAYSGQGP